MRNHEERNFINHSDEEPWEKPTRIALWLLLIIVFSAITLNKCYSQSHCEKAKLFIGEAKIDLSPASTPSVSIGLGISGIYGKGTILDNLSLIGGLKMAKGESIGKSVSDRFLTIPTATVLYRGRFNGLESKAIHAIGMTAGENYKEFTYRIYQSGNQAALGGSVGWNSLSGYQIGVSLMGFF